MTGTHRKTKQQTRLAHARVSNQEQFEQVVTGKGDKVGQSVCTPVISAYHSEGASDLGFFVPELSLLLHLRRTTRTTTTSTHIISSRTKQLCPSSPLGDSSSHSWSPIRESGGVRMMKCWSTRDCQQGGSVTCTQERPVAQITHANRGNGWSNKVVTMRVQFDGM